MRHPSWPSRSSARRTRLRTTAMGHRATKDSALKSYGFSILNCEDQTSKSLVGPTSCKYGAERSGCMPGTVRRTAPCSVPGSSSRTPAGVCGLPMMRPARRHGSHARKPPTKELTRRKPNFNDSARCSRKRDSYSDLLAPPRGVPLLHRSVMPPAICSFEQVGALLPEFFDHTGSG